MKKEREGREGGLMVSELILYLEEGLCDTIVPCVLLLFGLLFLLEGLRLGDDLDGFGEDLEMGQRPARGLVEAPDLQTKVHVFVLAREDRNRDVKHKGVAVSLRDRPLVIKGLRFELGNLLFGVAVIEQVSLKAQLGKTINGFARRHVTGRQRHLQPERGVFDDIVQVHLLSVLRVLFRTQRRVVFNHESLLLLLPLFLCHPVFTVPTLMSFLCFPGLCFLLRAGTRLYLARSASSLRLLCCVVL